MANTKLIVIIVVIVVILAALLLLGPLMWQAGVFDPGSGPGSGPNGGSGVRSTMVGFTTVKPIDWSCSNDQLQVVFVNAAGSQIDNLSVDGGSCFKGPVSAGGTVSCVWTNAPECAGAAVGDAFQADVSISYTSPTGLEKTSSGTVRGTVG